MITPLLTPPSHYFLTPVPLSFPLVLFSIHSLYHHHHHHHDDPTDTKQQSNHEIVTSSNIIDTDGTAIAVTHPPQPSNNNQHQSNHNNQHSNSQNHQGNNGSNPRGNGSERPLPLPTDQEADLEIGLERSRRDDGTGGGNQNAQGVGGRVHASQNNKKEEQGVVGVATVVTPPCRGQTQSGKNQSSRGRGFFLSNRLSSAKLNRSQKEAEANRRDNSAGRIQSEGRDNFDESMYPLPNDLIGGDTREQHPSTGADTMQTVGYSGRSNQVGNVTHHSSLCRVQS